MSHEQLQKLDVIRADILKHWQLFGFDKKPDKLSDALVLHIIGKSPGLRSWFGSCHAFPLKTELRPGGV